MAEKVPFAGPAWIEHARAILTDLAQTHGEPGRTFSVCERFTDAPRDIFPNGIAAWHFRIDGQAAHVAAGEIDDPDVTIRADYQATLPTARLVYTPEYLAKRAADRASGKGPAPSPGMAKAPPWLTELHNRLAVLTA